MQDQPSRQAIPEDRLTEEQLDSTVINCMLWDEGWPWTVEKLARELGNRPNAEDAVRRLTRTGLVHRLGDFVFPTRSARRAIEIAISAV
jgi:predicted transcriptional regulator